LPIWKCDCLPVRSGTKPQQRKGREMDTGIYELDRETNGLQNGHLIVLGGRPSMGKTSFALRIVSHVSVLGEAATLFFSLEQGAEALVNRMISMESGIDARKMRNGQLTGPDFERLLEAAVRISRTSNLVIDDAQGLSVDEIAKKSHSVNEKKQVGLIVIDYFQLMAVDDRTKALRRLKQLAEEIGCPVLLLSQISNACDKREDHRPTISDWEAESETAEIPDDIFFLYRNDYYSIGKNDSSPVELIVAKHADREPFTIAIKGTELRLSAQDTDNDISGKK